MNCGFVIDDEANRDPPFWVGDDHNPTNQLAFGRGLGGTLGLKGTWQVLAHGPRGNEDLPIRARQIRIITERTEHPVIERMLKVGSQLCELYGFGDHQDRKSVQFSDMLGRIIRTVGAYLILYNRRVRLMNIAKACFLLTFKYTKVPRIAGPWGNPPTLNILGISQKQYMAVCELYETLKLAF